MKMVSDTDGTCYERKECYKKTRNLFSPCNTTVETEAENNVNKDSTQHDYKRKLCNP